MRLKTTVYDRLVYETPHWQKGHLVAGVDEAGRGPLAGPVTAACVILPKEPLIMGVDDSKKLSEKKRETLFAEIERTAVAYCICFVEPDVIDDINILRATEKAMTQAILELSIAPDHILVDAIEKLPVSIPIEGIIRGDALSYVIGAASILAKVARDHRMIEYDKMYPEYGFAKHKGYGTKQHIEAIRQYGPLPIHRKSFIEGILSR